MKHFPRGAVFKVKFPEYKHDHEDDDDKRLNPHPHTVIQGIRKAIVLSGSELHFPKAEQPQILSKKHIAVIPISSATTEQADGRILPTYFPLDHQKYDFLDRKCFALANQIITIPIHWISHRTPQGFIDSEDMFAIDSLILISSGTLESVRDMIAAAVDEKVELALEQADKDA